jgi:hypothetical protein
VRRHLTAARDYPPGRPGSAPALGESPPKRGAGMTQKTRRKVLEALRNRAYFGYLLPGEAEEAVREALQDLPEGAREALAREVLEGERASVKGALLRFFQDLGVPPPPLLEKALGRGDNVLVGLWGEDRVAVIPGRIDYDPGEGIYIPLPRRERGKLPHLEVEARLSGTEIEVRAGKPKEGRREAFLFWLRAGKGRAFFHGSMADAAERTLEVVRAARGLFGALGLPDLEGALEALVNLEGETARAWKGYLLAGKGRVKGLTRGIPFGEPSLGGAFLLGGEVRLTSPVEDLGVSLRCGFEGAVVEVTRVSLRWRETVVEFPCRVQADPLAEDLGEEAVRAACRHLLTYESLPPKLEALLAGLSEEEHPTQALREEEFLRKVNLLALGRS